MQLSCSEISVMPNILSKLEKLNVSPEILLIKKRNSSQRGETFSHSQKRCKRDFRETTAKITVGVISSTDFVEKLISANCPMK